MMYFDNEKFMSNYFTQKRQCANSQGPDHSCDVCVPVIQPSRP